MWQTVLDTLPNILLGATLGGLVMFAITYANNSDWKKTRPGRALMYMVTAMIGVLAMAFAHLITGDYPGQEYVRLGIYGYMTYSVFNILGTLYKSLRVNPFWFIGIKRRGKERS